MTKLEAIAPDGLIASIRFQLDQLGAKNGHHQFEHLCRHFARQVISPNLLPATGPVSAGGDQGRDFESFTSFLANKKSDSAFFWGTGESKPLVFACSISKPNRIKAKIESDIREICSYGTPYIIYFFSNQDIPVAKRHALQRWCETGFSSKLEILDGQALAEQLSRPELFWIAEAYLNLPSEVFPRATSTSDPAYLESRQRWIVEGRIPQSFADFVEVKRCIRRATFDEVRRIDLLSWIRVADNFLATESVDDLRRRATYEICVAALRGLHDLTQKTPLVVSYFTEWGASDDPAALRDSGILLLYCSSAVLLGEFSFSTDTLHEWSRAHVSKVDEAIARAAGPNSLANLFQTRATAAQLPFLKGAEPHRNADELFKWWFKTVAAARKAILFPVEEFADLLTAVAEQLGSDPRYAELSGQVDQLLELRSKGYLVAEKSRDRAVAFLESNQTVLAINELHRAKVRWFTGDAMRGTVLTMLTLSEAYLKLGLTYAAKYHAFAAAFVVFKSSDDALKSLLPAAVYQICECEYEAGDWIAYAERFPLLLTVHYQHKEDPDDWSKHQSIMRAVFYFLVTRSWGTTLGGEQLATLVEEPLRELEMPEEIREEILNPPVSLQAYGAMSSEEIYAKAAEQLWGEPFSDCGEARVYRWRSLGIQWSVSCDNTIDCVPYVEEFVAVLQIAIADFGCVDLNLLPTSVELIAKVGAASYITLKENPNNKSLSFEILIPLSTDRTLEKIKRTQGEILAIANTLLVWCSTLPDDKIDQILRKAYKNELSTKAFLVRPYWELHAEFTDRMKFNARRVSAIPQLRRQEFSQRENDELSWRNGPGFGYTKAKAKKFIENRYRRGTLPIRFTLPRLCQSPRFQTWVADRRAEGLRDWQILLIVANAAMNFRLTAERTSTNWAEVHRRGSEIMSQGESENDDPLPDEFLFSDDARFMQSSNLMANAATWGLMSRAKTPDFEAWEKVLNERYFQSTDDVDHEDFFSAI